MSLSGNPASRKRLAMASAAVLTLPTESVVLISINCLKMSNANRRVDASGDGAGCACNEIVIPQKIKLSHHLLNPMVLLGTSYLLRDASIAMLKTNRFVLQIQVCREGSENRTPPRGRRSTTEMPRPKKT